MLHSLTPNIYVKNIPESVAFYTGIGFQPIALFPEDAPVWAMLVQDKAMIMLEAFSSLKEANLDILAETDKRTFSLFIKTDDIAEVRTKIEGKCKILKDLYTTNYGMKELVIEDNDGNILIFGEDGDEGK